MSNGMKVKRNGLYRITCCTVCCLPEFGHALRAEREIRPGTFDGGGIEFGTRTKTPEELEVALGLLSARVSFGVSTERMQLSGSCLKKFSSGPPFVEEMFVWSLVGMKRLWN